MEKAGEIEAKSMPLIVSAPTVFELYVGITLSSKAEEEKARVLAVIESLPFLPLDAESSRASGRIYAEKSSQLPMNIFMGLSFQISWRRQGSLSSNGRQWAG